MIDRDHTIIIVSDDAETVERAPPKTPAPVCTPNPRVLPTSFLTLLYYSCQLMGPQPAETNHCPHYHAPTPPCDSASPQSGTEVCGLVQSLLLLDLGQFLTFNCRCFSPNTGPTTPPNPRTNWAHLVVPLSPVRDAPPGIVPQRPFRSRHPATTAPGGHTTNQRAPYRRLHPVSSPGRPPPTPSGPHR
ncbi:unnamed protein product [Lota lota]